MEEDRTKTRREGAARGGFVTLLPLPDDGGAAAAAAGEEAEGQNHETF